MKTRNKISIPAILLAIGIIAAGVATSNAAVFAKYDGVDGESADPNHDKWIDVLSIDWGSHKPGGGATGQSRRRGTVIVEDMRLTMEYEKSTPVLLEKCHKGEVIPKLEIEQTANYGGSRATYLKYELTNLQIVSYQVHVAADGKATLEVSMAFERMETTHLFTGADGEVTEIHSVIDGPLAAIDRR